MKTGAQKNLKVKNRGSSMNKKIALVVCVFVFFMAVHNASAISQSIGLKDYVLDFDYEEDDVTVGETFLLKVTVTNEAGETRNNVEVSLELDDPFDTVGDDSKNIGSLDDGESKTVTFRVEVDDNTNEDEYDLGFEVKDDKGKDSDEIAVDVKSNEADIIVADVSSLPTVITPDTEDIMLTVTLENTGDKEAKYVRAKLRLPEGFTPSGSYTDIANLGTIFEGSSDSMIFYIDSGEFVASGSHKAFIDLSYESGGDSVTDTLSFDLPVKGRPQFLVVSSETDPGVIHVGEDGEILIRIQNVGAVEGKETSIRVFENSDQPFDFNEKTNYVGSLEPGEEGTGAIKFTVDKDATAKTYLVRMQIRTVSDGNVLVEEKSLPVKVEEMQRNNVVYYLVIGVIVFIILLILVLYLTRRKD